MRTILLTTTDPYFNLAAEEYLLLHGEEDICMLWRNSRSVIIGKNQNAWAEVNVPFTEKNGIAVVRRLSGGGAVFHDPGNVNYTFITAHGAEDGIDFAKFTAPVLFVLAELGVEAELGGRNDILVDGVKISGNAQAVYRRPDGTTRKLHHGAILFGADLGVLSEALVVHPEKIRTKGIASVRSRVANLRDLPGFPRDITVTDFVDLLARRLSGNGVVTSLTAEETAGVEKLRREKYGTWQWNFGASARHTTEYTARFSFGTLTASYTAVGGTVSEIRLYGDYFGTAPIGELEEKLVGVLLRRGEILSALQSIPQPVDAYIAGATAEEIAGLLLGEKGNERKNDSLLS